MILPAARIVGDDAFAPFVEWQDSIARLTDPQAIVTALLPFAAQNAATEVSPVSTQAITARRIGGMVSAWRLARPSVPAGRLRGIIDDWIEDVVFAIMAFFDRNPWGNNLHATAALIAWREADALGSFKAKSWAVQAMQTVLDTVTAAGLFTKEVTRSNNEKAEYYAYETMLYAVALAQVEPSLWSYVGKGGGDPAILRAGRALDSDMGNHKLYQAATAKPQIAYPGAIGTLPSGYMGGWINAFLKRYPGSFPSLSVAKATYDKRPGITFNSILGSG